MAPSSRWRRIRRLHDLPWAILFLAPSFIGFAVFTLLPVVASLALSFVDWNLIRSPRYVGLANYREALNDPIFWKVMRNTAYYTAGSVPLGIGLSLGLAVLLNRKLRGVEFLRTLYFLPVVSSTVAVSLVWKWLYEPNFGLINYALSLVGISPIGWLTTTTWAMPAVIILSVWKGLGHSMVIFLAGLQSIPRQLYEAAEIDGASRWRQFWDITRPLLSPTTFFVLVISIIGSMQVFSQVFVMTNGGPANSTSTIVYYIYQKGFNEFRMGYASTLSWLLFAVIFAFTLVQLRLQRNWVSYD